MPARPVSLRPAPRSHGTGRFRRSQLAACGRGTVIEHGVLVFHPEHIALGCHVYVGHHTILKGYFRNRMEIGDGTWIGQQCFLHSGGGLRIGRHVGIGPGVLILTSHHDLAAGGGPILHRPVRFAPVVIGDGADIGVGAILLPGVRIGREAQVGAGAVVTRDVPEHAVVAGVPARPLAARRALRVKR